MIKQVALLWTCSLFGCLVACDYDWRSLPAPAARPDASVSVAMAVREQDSGMPSVMTSTSDAAAPQPALDAGAAAEPDAGPVETPIRCDAASNPEHGKVTPHAGRSAVDGIAEYSCLSGYTLQGDAQRSCQADGNWSAAAPSCKPVSCGPLSDPKLGSVSLSGTDFGDSAHYACSSGYVLIGPATRNCQADGHWSAAAPSCECSSDPSSDPLNCGACGMRCASGACAAGQCVRRVFLSSSALAPSFGSLAQADAACQRLASTATLPGSFKAWLSDVTGSPSTRFAKGNGEYRRTDGVKVADNFTDLCDGTLQNPINVTETGQAADTASNTFVYTGTAADGNVVSIAASDPNATFGATCQAWTTNAGSAWGAYGTFTTVTASWSYGGGRIACSSMLPIYCVEQ